MKGLAPLFLFRTFFIGLGACVYTMVAKSIEIKVKFYVLIFFLKIMYRNLRTPEF